MSLVNFSAALQTLSPSEDATQKQRTASNPLHSSWVGASAGSGKTKVLTDRILRLLLPRENGEPATKPEKILALTFTKAAANEMAMRLSKRLAAWSIASDAELEKDMHDNLLGRPPTAEESRAARQLFAQVIDAPGGMNIMTIHSFCQSVLGRFPIEADVPPHFNALEESESQALLERAFKDTFDDSEKNIGSPLQTAILNLSQRMTADTLQFLLKSALSERHQFQKLYTRYGSVDGLYTALCATLDIPAGVDDADIVAQACAVPKEQENRLRFACSIMALKGKDDPQKAALIQTFLDAPEENRATYFESYVRAFLKAGGEPYAKLVTKTVSEKHPDIAAVLQEEQERILGVQEQRKENLCALCTRDFFLIFHAILLRYDDIKRRQGALDFDDMILKTLALLNGDSAALSGLDVAPWVMFKMDGGLDHILVDEAQDTNPEQWDIIRLLAEEFFSGIGAKDITRTLFVVGDDKQSIYGFQRAAPEKFGSMYRYFQEKITDSGKIFESVDMNTSFRSAQAVLDVVDYTFMQEAPDTGISASYRAHRANRTGQAGLVEIWPILESEQENTNGPDSVEDHSPGWSIPDKPLELKSGSLQMGNKIGDTIKGWIESRELLPSYDRPIQAGDILVLVRSRTAFVNQLVRKLKSDNIPVSGLDRMALMDQLVVQDLCALANFALLPADDLTLACILKSPFIGWDEEALFEHSHTRDGSLWDAVCADERSAPVRAWLKTIRSRAHTLSPYEFFGLIVQEPCPTSNISGLHAIRMRLGEDALDPLDEFLTTALQYERTHEGGLYGYLQWHKNASSEIKRDLDDSSGVVRIMTIHGAKGLQAPIVFMPDAIRPAKAVQGNGIFWPHKTGMDVPFYCPSSAMMPQKLKPAQMRVQMREDEESRRLLYVGMTRAEERLYIGGYKNNTNSTKDQKRPTWYKQIVSGLDGRSEIINLSPEQDLDHKAHLRLLHPREAEPDKAEKNAPRHKTMAEEAAQKPIWLYAKAPQEPTPPRPLVPSRPSEDDPPAISPLAQGDDGSRFKRGTITHKAFQILPMLPADQREPALRRFLAQGAHGLSIETQDSMAQEIMAVLNHPDFAPLFSEEALAEVPITGLIGTDHLISGQIDRLLVTADEVLIVDFKTNRPPPLNPADVAPVYKRQLALYKSALRTLYPHHRIRTALLWTDGARLMEIEAD